MTDVPILLALLVAATLAAGARHVFPTFRIPRRRLEAGQRMDVVVAAYREDMTWLRAFTEGRLAGAAARVIVYSKHPDTGVVDGRASVVLPNVGRCDHTYLHHIVANYERLADTTLFLTGSARALWWKWLPLRFILLPRLGAPDGIVSGAVRPLTPGDRRLALDVYGASGPGAGRVRPVVPAAIRPFGAWWTATFPDRAEPRFVAVGGVFAARRAAIHRVPLAVWRALLEQHAIADNVEVGHYMERSWYALLSA